MKFTIYLYVKWDYSRRFHFGSLLYCSCMWRLSSANELSFFVDSTQKLLAFVFPALTDPIFRRLLTPFIWQRKKDQTTHVNGNQKMAALIRQANSWHQMKQTKHLKPPEKRKRWPTCKHKVEKTPPNHNSLIDYCLQQMSGWLHWLHFLQP